MDNPAVGLIVFLGVFIIFGFITYVTTNSHKIIIQNELTKKGAGEINISWVWLDFDKSNHTYNVDYKDAQGIRHSATCKIHVWGSDIYWKD
jgi:hypothetical protein